MPGGVDEQPLAVAQDHDLVDRVDGGPGDLGDDGPVLSRQLVEQRGLAHVRLADQRHAPGAGVVRPTAALLGQDLQDRVQQVAAAPPVQCRHRVGLPEAERPQHRRVGLGTLVVDLVRRQHHGLARAPQDLDDRLLGVRGPDRRVDDEDDHVGDRHRALGLVGDPGREPTGVRVPAAGVEQDEATPRPVGVIGDPIARHPRDVLHDRLTATEDPVDERGLADVGPPDDRDHRQGVPAGLGQVVLVELDPELLGSRRECRALSLLVELPGGLVDLEGAVAGGRVDVAERHPLPGFGVGCVLARRVTHAPRVVEQTTPTSPVAWARTPARRADPPRRYRPSRPARRVCTSPEGLTCRRVCVGGRAARVGRCGRWGGGWAAGAQLAAQASSHDRHDRGDDLVEGQVRPVDLDRAVRATQRGHGPPGVDRVALGQRGGGRGDVARGGGGLTRAPGILQRPTGGTGLGVGGEEDLGGGIGQDDRPDVPALDHDPPTPGERRRDHSALQLDQPRPDLGHGRHRTHGPGHGLPADRLTDVDAVHGDRRGLGVRGGAQHRPVSQRGDGRGIGDVHPAVEHVPGHRPVHRPGVQVVQAQRAGHAPAGAGLAAA